MIYRNAKVEISDPESRFVLKRITTTDWEAMNRKMSVTNQLFSYEESRTNYGKDLFVSPFQTYHIRWDKKYWDFYDIDVAKTHAQKNNRVFIPQRQFNLTQWKTLQKGEAFNQYTELLNKGLPIGTMQIPLKTTASEFEQIETEAESILNGTQEFMPIFSTRHDFMEFPDIIESQIKKKRKFVGLHCYGMTEPQEIVNLASLRKINASVPAGGEIPVFVGFDFDRHLGKHSYVASTFGYSCFGIDVFSERQYFIHSMPKKVVEDMMKRTPDDYMFYDRSQGRFNKGEDQEAWHELNLTRETLHIVRVEEGLNGYQTIIWNNAQKQLADLNLLNAKLLERFQQKPNFEEFITAEKSGWSTFYKTVVKPRG